MHTGYHRRRAWEARVLLLLLGCPLLLLAAWLLALAGLPDLVVATLVTLAVAEALGTWLVWRSKP